MATEKAKPLMSKKAARAAAEKEQSAKKSSKPANKKSAAKTPKSKKPAKPAKTKGKKAEPRRASTALVQIIEPGELATLQLDAKNCWETLTDGVPQLFAMQTNLYAAMDDFKARELWRHLPTPFKSEGAALEELAKIAGVTKRTLQLVASANKALPKLPPATKKKIGARKLAKAAAAVKRHREQTGNPEAELPSDIIKAAEDESESKFDETLRDAGLAPEPEAEAPRTEPMFNEPVPDGLIDDPVNAEGREPKVDPLLHHEPADQSFRRGKKGASGAVEGEHGTAQQFSSVVQLAVEAAMLIDPEIESEIKALESIAAQWLKFPCVREDLQDMTNDAAFDHLGGKRKSNGKRKK